jgi:hypothetical protein
LVAQSVTANTPNDFAITKGTVFLGNRTQIHVKKACVDCSRLSNRGRLPKSKTRIVPRTNSGRLRKSQWSKPPSCRVSFPRRAGDQTGPDRTQRQAAAPRIGKVAPGSCLPAGRHRKGCQVAGRLPSRAEPARVRVRTPAAALRLSYRTCARQVLRAYY